MRWERSITAQLIEVEVRRAVPLSLVLHRRGATPIAPTLADALRRVGLALGLGGLLNVFGVTNLVRLIEGGRGGWAWFDVAGMTLGMIGGALFLLAGVMEQAGKVQAELDEMI